jgi:hypothetical protein
MDQISIMSPSPKCWLFFKIDQQRYSEACVYLSTVRPPIPPPLFYTLYEYIPGPILIHAGKGGGGWWTSVKGRGAIVHKRGRKYQHEWLYLQSLNSIKRQWRRHLGFGVFIDIWSMDCIHYMHILLYWGQSHTNSMNFTKGNERKWRS